MYNIPKPTVKTMPTFTKATSAEGVRQKSSVAEKSCQGISRTMDSHE